MKYTLKKTDTVTTHSFELAGKQAIIYCENACVAEGWVTTEVRVGDLEPVHMSGFTVATSEDAERESNANSDALQNAGTFRPSDIKVGDIMDAGSGDNEGAVQELCAQLRLNGDDITDYEYVDLSVRAASLALARKIILQHRRNKSSSIKKTKKVTKVSKTKK